MEARQEVLRKMQICRFCLCEGDNLINIHQRTPTDTQNKNAIPLPLQIMACLAIEVFANDGMPQLICRKCQYQTIQAYNFKQTCKKSDDALKLFLATGTLKKPAAQGRKRPAIEIIENPKRIQTEEPNLKDEVLQHVEMHEVDPLEEVIEEHVEIINEEVLEKLNPTLKVSQVKTNVFPCPSCERSFPLQQLLDLHMVIHKRDRNFECNLCERKFFTKYDLGKHIQIHTDDKPFTCSICSKQFSRESLLHRHEKIHVDVPKYLCTICDKTFLNKEDLDYHADKHKKKRPFACRLCNKSFVFKQGLERHEITHADQKPHKCNYCEASFTSPIKLTRHITSHAGLRPYPCKLCGRTFLLSHHLTRHMRSHYAGKSPHGSPIGQHKCDTCSMSFKRKDSLINHSAIHSMVNLKCVICNTAFETAKMVKEHITTHLSGLPYPCDNCDYSFESQEQLEEHELKHAEMEYEEQIEKEISMEAEVEDFERDHDDDMSDEDDEDVAQFTITNPENPEVVPVVSGSRRKSRNFAQFLRDELGSDLDDEIVEETSDGELIKPVIRTEGTKVYARKTILPKLTPSPFRSLDIPTTDTTQLDSLEELGLTKQAVNALPNKKYVDMKVGDKTVRVQKLMMTKAEIEAMAKEGRIEMKGNTILLRKPQTKVVATSEEATLATKPGNQLTLEEILDDDAKKVSTGPIITKTYTRKPTLEKSEEKEEVVEDEVVKEDEAAE